jgi:dipicolinate synthase subunit A
MRLALVGGGARELETARHLARLGHVVHTVGLQPGDRPDIWRTLSAVIGPVLGTDAAGQAFYRPDPPGPLLIDPVWIGQVPGGTPWLVGSCGPWLRQALAERQLPLHTYAQDEAFAQLNAVPTAEGAIAEAARASGRTAWGTRATVVGCGRCGLALVRSLRAQGARVQAVAREADARAAAASDWVFNTVPAPVLGSAQLAVTEPRVVVIDVASSPGGTDFSAATRLGRSAYLVGAIPDRYPVTSGGVLAEVVLDILGRGRDGGNGDAGV